MSGIVYVPKKKESKIIVKNPFKDIKEEAKYYGTEEITNIKNEDEPEERRKSRYDCGQSKLKPLIEKNFEAVLLLEPYKEKFSVQTKNGIEEKEVVKLKTVCRYPEINKHHNNHYHHNEEYETEKDGIVPLLLSPSPTDKKRSSESIQVRKYSFTEAFDWTYFIKEEDMLSLFPIGTSTDTYEGLEEFQGKVLCPFQKITSHDNCYITLLNHEDVLVYCLCIMLYEPVVFSDEWNIINIKKYHENKEKYDAYSKDNTHQCRRRFLCMLTLTPDFSNHFKIMYEMILRRRKQIHILIGLFELNANKDTEDTLEVIEGYYHHKRILQPGEKTKYSLTNSLFDSTGSELTLTLTTPIQGRDGLIASNCFGKLFHCLSVSSVINLLGYLMRGCNIAFRSDHPGLVSYCILAFLTLYKPYCWSGSVDLVATNDRVEGYLSTFTPLIFGTIERMKIIQSYKWSIDEKMVIADLDNGTIYGTKFPENNNKTGWKMVGFSNLYNSFQNILIGHYKKQPKIKLNSINSRRSLEKSSNLENFIPFKTQRTGQNKNPRKTSSQIEKSNNVYRSMMEISIGDNDSNSISNEDNNMYEEWDIIDDHHNNNESRSKLIITPDLESTENNLTSMKQQNKNKDLSKRKHQRSRSLSNDKDKKTSPFPLRNSSSKNEKNRNNNNNKDNYVKPTKARSITSFIFPEKNKKEKSCHLDKIDELLINSLINNNNGTSSSSQEKNSSQNNKNTKNNTLNELKKQCILSDDMMYVTPTSVNEEYPSIQLLQEIRHFHLDLLEIIFHQSDLDIIEQTVIQYDSLLVNLDQQHEEKLIKRWTYNYSKIKEIPIEQLETQRDFQLKRNFIYNLVSSIDFRNLVEIAGIVTLYKDTENERSLLREKLYNTLFPL